MHTVELTIQRKRGDSWPVTVSFSRSGHFLPLRSDGEIALDLHQLEQISLDPKAYGRSLGEALFQGGIRDAFTRAVSQARQFEPGYLRVLLFVEAEDLRELHWERLCVPLDNAWSFLSGNQQTPFSLYLPSTNDRRFPPIGKRDLRALVLIAGQADLDGDYALDEFDTAASASSIRSALGEIPCDVLASLPDAAGPPSLDELCRRITAERYSLLHIVCHGRYRSQDGETLLYIPDGTRRPITATTLIDQLCQLGASHGLPHLAFLSTCTSAAPGAESGLGGLGQRFVRQLGMPAVVAMTDVVTIQTAEELAAAFYTHLKSHGEPDRALAEAAAGLLGRADVTFPALFSRLGGRPLFSDSLDRPLTAREIEAGLVSMGRLLSERAPILGTEFASHAQTLRGTLKTDVQALSPEAQRERQQALDAINQTCFEVLDVSFQALALGQEPPPYDSRPPFRGLYAFHPEDREFFFGREALVEKLAKRIREHNFLAVLGPSGSGKSSLVLAGLVPALNKPLIYLTPNNDPLAQLETALRKGRMNSIVVVDQFEELFTLCNDPFQRQAFIDHLLPLSKKQPVILTMRADFWGEVALYPKLRDAMQSHLELISPMDAAELRRAMDLQAGHVGLRFEADLSQDILDDVQDEPGAMPLLQHALLLLWNRRHGRWLRSEEYRALGGIREAIARTADELYEKLTDAERERVRDIFVRLTRLDEGSAQGGEGRDTRRRVTLEELVPAGQDAALTTQLVQRLADARLVVTGVNAANRQQEVEVAHEALIRYWPRLRAWLAEDRVILRLREGIREAALEWEAGKRPTHLLVHRGGRLEDAEALMHQPRFALNALELDYVRACIDLRERERILLERRRRRTIIAAVIVALIMTMMGCFGWYQAIQARDQAQRADLALGTATHAQGLALFQAQTAQAANLTSVSNAAYAQTQYSIALTSQNDADFQAKNAAFQAGNAQTQAAYAQTQAAAAATEAANAAAKALTATYAQGNAYYQAANAQTQAAYAKTSQADAQNKAATAKAAELTAQAGATAEATQKIGAQTAEAFAKTKQAEATEMGATAAAGATSANATGIAAQTKEADARTQEAKANEASTMIATQATEAAATGFAAQTAEAKATAAQGQAELSAAESKIMALAGQAVDSLKTDWVAAFLTAVEANKRANNNPSFKPVVSQTARGALLAVNQAPAAGFKGFSWPDSSQLTGMQPGYFSNISYSSRTLASQLAQLAEFTPESMDVINNPLNPAQKILAIGGAPNTVLVWSISGNNVQLVDILETPSRVMSVALSQDGFLAAGTYGDEPNSQANVFIWKNCYYGIHTCELVDSFLAVNRSFVRPNEWGLNIGVTVAFGSNNRLAAGVPWYASFDIRDYNSDNHNWIQTYYVYFGGGCLTSQPVYDLTFSQDGDILGVAVGTGFNQGGILRIDHKWITATPADCAAVKTLPIKRSANVQRFYRVAFGGNGVLAASGYNGVTVFYGDCATMNGQCTDDYQHFSGAYNTDSYGILEVSPNGTIARRQLDSSEVGLMLWKNCTVEEGCLSDQPDYFDTGASASAIAFGNDGTLYVGHVGGAFSQWAPCQMESDYCKSPLAIIDERESLVKAGLPLDPPSSDPGPTDIAYSPELDLFGAIHKSATDKSFIYLWRCNSSVCDLVQKFDAGIGDSYSLAFSPNKLLAVAGSTGLAVWECSTNGCYNKHSYSTVGFLIVAFSNNNTLVASTTASGGLYFYKCQSGTSDGCTQDGDNRGVSGVTYVAVAFSKDNILAVGKSAGADTSKNGVDLWDCSLGCTPIETIKTTFGSRLLAINTDGWLIASHEQSGYFLIWECNKGKNPPDTCSSKVVQTTNTQSIQFGKSSNLLAAGRYSGVELYNTLNWQPFGNIFVDYSNPASSRSRATFNSDGNFLAVNGYGFSVWRIDPVFWQQRACDLAGRNFTQAEWAQLFPGEPYIRTCDQWPPGQ